VNEIEVKPTFEDSFSVREAKILDEKERRVRITVISVGPGNNKWKNFYTQEAIESAPEIFEGATFGMNHNKALAEKQPEGVIQDIGGWLENCEVVGEKLDADAVVLPGPSYEWFWTLLKQSIVYAQRFPGRNLMGVSVDAKCTADGTLDLNGEQWNKINKFIGVKRVDAVTTPARGGMIQKIISEAMTNIPLMAGRLMGFGKIVSAMESDAAEDLIGGASDKAVSANISRLVRSGYGQDEAVVLAMKKAGRNVQESDAPTDPAAIYAALMTKVRNLESSGAPGVDEVRRQLDELGTALKFNKTEDNTMDYPGVDPTASSPADGGAGDMGDEALSPKDHAMAATFHKNMAAQCNEAEAGGAGMKAHHLKMAKFHAAKAAEGDATVTVQHKADAPVAEPTPTEAEAKAKEEAEAKAKTAEAEAKAKTNESDPDGYGKAGLKLLKESEIAKAGLTEAHKNYLMLSLESETDPTKIKKEIAAYVAVHAQEAGTGHNFQRRSGAGSANKSNLVGALRSSGVLAEE
jgi:hypothetical protein